MRNEILDYFRKADGNFVSGQQISKDLHVSRTAIWKHINVLKEIIIPQHVKDVDGSSRMVFRPRYSLAYQDELKSK